MQSVWEDGRGMKTQEQLKVIAGHAGKNIYIQFLSKNWMHSHTYVINMKQKTVCLALSKRNKISKDPLNVIDMLQFVQKPSVTSKKRHVMVMASLQEVSMCGKKLIHHETVVGFTLCFFVQSKQTRCNMSFWAAALHFIVPTTRAGRKCFWYNKKNTLLSELWQTDRHEILHNK